MKSLKSRLGSLERRSGDNKKHHVIVVSGEDQEQKVREYKEANPGAEDILVIKIVTFDDTDELETEGQATL